MTILTILDVLWRIGVLIWGIGFLAVALVLSLMPEINSEPRWRSWLRTILAWPVIAANWLLRKLNDSF